MDLYAKALSSSLRMCSRPPHRRYSLLPSRANQKFGPRSIVLSLPVVIDSRPYHCDTRIYWLCTGAVRHRYYLNTALPGAESGDALLTRSFWVLGRLPHPLWRTLIAVSVVSCMANSRPSVIINTRANPPKLACLLRLARLRSFCKVLKNAG